MIDITDIDLPDLTHQLVDLSEALQTDIHVGAYNHDLVQFVLTEALRFCVVVDRAAVAGYLSAVDAAKGPFVQTARNGPNPERQKHAARLRVTAAQTALRDAADWPRDRQVVTL